MGMTFAKQSTVTLNLFQGPGAVVRQTGRAREAADRAWMLKQVQHDVIMCGSRDY